MMRTGGGCRRRYSNYITVRNQLLHALQIHAPGRNQSTPTPANKNRTPTTTTDHSHQTPLPRPLLLSPSTRDPHGPQRCSTPSTSNTSNQSPSHGSPSTGKYMHTPPARLPQENNRLLQQRDVPGCAGTRVDVRAHPGAFVDSGNACMSCGEAVLVI